MSRSTLLLLAAALSFHIACSKPVTVESYEKDGVRFSHFSNWKVSKDEPIEGAPGTRVLHVEGPDSALMSIIWLPAASETTLADFAASVAQGRAEEVKKALGPIEAMQESTGSSEPSTDQIAGHERTGIRQKFDIVLLGNHVPHEATFYLLETPTHKVILMSQVAKENLAATRPAWQKVYDTLALTGLAELTTSR
jgi:hypothetical protein